MLEDDMLEDAFFPQIVRLDATWRCNLNCKHCQTGMFRGTDHPQDLSDAAWTQLFEDLAQMGTQQINFLGGEPLLRTSLLDHIDHLTRLGIRSDVTTNGILINDENARRLLLDNRANVTVSLDGASSQTHDHIRGRNTFTRTIAAIEKLVSVRDQAHAGGIGLSVVLNRNNLHETEAIIDLAQSLGVNWVILASVHKVGNAIRFWDDLSLENQELYDAGVRIAQRLTTVPSSLGVRVNFFTALFVDHLRRKYGFDLKQEVSFDRASLFECYIQCEGLVFPSQKFSEMNPEILANGSRWGIEFAHNSLHQRSISDIWSGAEFERYRSLATKLAYVKSYETCRDCAFAKNYCIPNAGAAINGESSPQQICEHLHRESVASHVAV
jgi:MoaA/NifB/PqqE/SkfB family radical SAM enzyme